MQTLRLTHRLYLGLIDVSGGAIAKKSSEMREEEEGGREYAPDSADCMWRMGGLTRNEKAELVLRDQFRRRGRGRQGKYFPV